MNSLRAFGDKFGQRIGHRAEHMPHVRNSVMSGGPGPAALRIVTPSACESDGQTVRGRNKIACEMLQQHAVPGRVCRQYGGLNGEWWWVDVYHVAHFGEDVATTQAGAPTMARRHIASLSIDLPA